MDWGLRLAIRSATIEDTKPKGTKMTDQTIPADDVREIIGKMRYHANHDNVRGTEEEYVRFFASQLEDLLPTPTPPTLADMTKEERRDCEWMQCDVAGLGGAWLIIDPFDDEDHVHVIGRKGDSRILPATSSPRVPTSPAWSGREARGPTPRLPCLTGGGSLTMRKRARHRHQPHPERRRPRLLRDPRRRPPGL